MVSGVDCCVCWCVMSGVVWLRVVWCVVCGDTLCVVECVLSIVTTSNVK